MSLYDDFMSAATHAYLAQQKRDAALLFRRAKEAAEQLTDHVNAWAAGVWEAICVSLTGDDRRAYGLLFLLLSDVPDNAPRYERWLAEVLNYQLWCSLGDRLRSERLKRLERLKEYATAVSGVPLHDVH